MKRQSEIHFNLNQATQKIFCISILTILVSISQVALLFSQSSGIVDIKTAETTAINYCLKTEKKYAKATSGDINLSLAEKRSSGNNVLYYVFNINQNDGFIIISADFNLAPVICYVPQGTYTKYPELRPPGFNEWLDSYSSQIVFSLNRPAKDTLNSKLWASLTSKGQFDTETMVLKLTSKWNQTSNFNVYSPTTGNTHPTETSGSYGNRTPTGCVATAMGQIMYYYKWPLNGVGSHSYSDPANPNTNSSCGLLDPSYGTLSFLNHTSPYNFASMVDVPATPNNEISKLLYNCAVSVDMDFAYCQSWTLTSVAEDAYRNYFNYNTSVDYIKRSDFPDTWESIIIDQIQKERPVQYRGQSGTGTVGHSWVCYGYRTVAGAKEFMFNWGWGGSYDGFYSITGSSLQYPYNSTNSENGAIINIYPTSQANLTVPSSSVNTSPIYTFVPFTVNFTVSNNGTVNAGGSTAACYLSANTTLDNSDALLGTISIPSLTIGQSSDFSKTVTIGGVPTGTYYILIEADTDHDVHESDESDNIIAVQIWVQSSPVNTGDYQSAANGSWTDLSTWQYYNGTTWGPATTYPNNTSGKIYIRSPHSVTISSNISVDEVNILSGGKVTVSSGYTMTIANGTDDVDFSVNGSLVNSGTITAIGKLSFNNGSVYEHTRDGGAIPVATWDIASNCNITGAATTAPAIPSETQPFGNFSWNCPSQNTNFINLSGQLTTIAGDFNVISTGPANQPFDLRLGSNTTGDLTVKGNFVQTGGSFLIEGEGNSTNSRTMTVEKDFTLGSNGTFLISYSSGGGTLNIQGNFNSLGTFYFAGWNSINSATLNISGNCSIAGGSFIISNTSLAGRLYVSKNFTHSGGTINVSSTGSGFIVFNGAGIQTFITGVTISDAVNFTVNSGATLQMGAAETTVSGTGSFTLLPGATLGITSPYGITTNTTGATGGNIQVTGTRLFDAGANYIYNGSSSQSTGNGLPGRVNSLKFNNAGGTITLNSSQIITNNFSISTGSIADLGSFSHTAGTVTLGSFLQTGCSYGSTASPADFKTNTYFTGTGSVSTGPCTTGTWLGKISNDWNSAGNWYGAIIPGSNADVVINSIAPYNPVVSNSPVSAPTAQCKNLTLNQGTTLIVNSGNALTVNQKLTNNGTLNLKSDASGIASLELNEYVDNGSENIELYLSGGGTFGTYKWHYISSPVSTPAVSASTFTLNTLDLAQYIENMPVSTTPYNLMRGWIAFDNYSYFTGETPATPNYSFTNLTPGKGYLYYYASNSVYALSGSINTASVSQPLSYSSIDDSKSGFNLLGNPYTCGLDIQYMFDHGWPSNTIKTIWFTKDNISCIYQNGVGIPGSTESFIPPMQGFFVKANSAGIFNFPLSARVHTSTPRYKGNKSMIPLIRLSVAENGKSAETVIRFDNSAKSGLDLDFDAPRMFSSTGSAEIYSSFDELDYMVLGLPFPDSTVIIPLVMSFSQPGNHTITTMKIQELGDYQIMLTDKLTNTSVDLKLNPVITINSPELLIKDRFSLAITKIMTGIEQPEAIEDPFKIFSDNNFINIQTLADKWDGKTGSIKVIDLSGRTILDRSNVQFLKSTQIKIGSPFKRGLYLIKMRSDLMTYVGKLMIR